MEAHVIYCSACDREVRVVFPIEPAPSDAAIEVDPKGICADYCSQSCTGTVCALFDLPPEEMRQRLLQSGLISDKSQAPRHPRLNSH
jgi:hypothetical protein